MLGGSFEFLPYNGKEDSDEKRNALVKVFSLLDYNFGTLTQAEKDYLADSTDGIPKNWNNYKNFSLRIITLSNGKKVGIAPLPEFKGGVDELPAGIVTKLTNNLRQFKKKVDILIGMSPWGYFREKKLLESSDYLDCPLDILLGSGEGPGLTGRISANGKTLWVRGYPTGKAVGRIDILNWPEKDSDFQWESGRNISWLVHSLLKNTREDPEVLNLLIGISDEK